MAIVQVPYPNALPTNQTDYARQNTLLFHGFLRVNEPCAIDGGNITQGAVFQCGGVVYYAESDTAIGGAASNYVQLAPNGDGSELIPTYVANLAGVSWNTAYNGYYDGSGNLYVFNEALALLNGTLPAGVLEQRYAEQERTGDLPVGRDLVAGRDVEATQDVNAGQDVNATRDIVAGRNAEITGDANIGGDAAVTGGAAITGKIDGGGGYYTSSWISSVNSTENEWFDTFSPYVPNVNDTILVSGGIAYSGNTYAVSHLKRQDANTVRVYFIRMDAVANPGSYDCVNGDGTVFTSDLCLAW